MSKIKKINEKILHQLSCHAYQELSYYNNYSRRNSLNLQKTCNVIELCN